MSSTATNPPPTEPTNTSALQSPTETEFRDSPPSPAQWDVIGESMLPEFQFLTCNWIEPWDEHLLAENGWTGPLHYFIANDAEGQITAAVPFAYQTKARIRFRSLAGLYVPLRGLPIAQEAIASTVDKLADFLTANHDGMGLRLAPVPVLDPALGPLISRLQSKGWRASSRHVGYRQIVNLPATFEEYEAERKGSRWKTIGKRERKAEREHDVKLTLYTTEDCEDWGPVIRDLGEIEQLSWLPEEDGDMWFVGDAKIQFWTEVFNAQRAGLAARVWIQYFNGKPATFDFNLDSGQCRYSVAGHYIKDVHTYGTGSILMKHMVRDAISRGITKIDMGTGNSGYKTFWGAEMADQIIDWSLYPPGLKGTALYWAASTLHTVRSAKTRVLQVKERLLSRAKTKK